MFMRVFTGFTAVLMLAGCQQPAPVSTQTAAPAHAAPAQSPADRGKYLVTVGGCHDCHTPKMVGPNGPEADMSRLLSGNPATEKLAKVPAGLIAPDKWLTITNNHLGAWAGPWGVSFAANLT